jgi:hypothetical protein
LAALGAARRRAGGPDSPEVKAVSWPATALTVLSGDCAGSYQLPLAQPPTTGPL